MCKSEIFAEILNIVGKDTIDDPDAPDGTTMRRWYVTMIAAGIPIEWDEML